MDDATLSEAGREGLAAVLADPEHALFGFDFDGTLSPIVDDPSQAFIHPGARDALSRLGSLVGTVAIVTGRPAKSVVALGGFADGGGLGDLIVRGQYGVERWDAASGEFDIPPAPREIEAFETDLVQLLADLDLSDAPIEHKFRAIGVHTRPLPNAEAAFERLREPVADLADKHGLHLEPGRLVLEVRPAGMDKGLALTDLVAERGAQSLVFAGDDLGDLPAFEAAIRLRAGGVPAVLVRSASEEQDALAGLCDLAVEGPAGIAAWLQELCDRIENVRPR